MGRKMKTILRGGGYPSPWLLVLIGVALVVGLVFALVRAFVLALAG